MFHSLRQFYLCAQWQRRNYYFYLLNSLQSYRHEITLVFLSKVCFLAFWKWFAWMLWLLLSPIAIYTWYESKYLVSTNFAWEFIICIGPTVYLGCWVGTLMEKFQEIEVPLASTYFLQSWTSAALLPITKGKPLWISASPRKIMKQRSGI